MDDHRFDAMIRAFSSERSRRGALAMISGVLAAPLFGAPTLAKKKKKKKKITVCHNGQTVKIPKKDRSQFLLGGATLGACPASPPPPPPPGSTCTDGVKNGDETGIDCGGSCPVCATDQGCHTASDCATGFCDNDAASPTGKSCATCPVGQSTSCGSDDSGLCVCFPLTNSDSDEHACVPLGSTITAVECVSGSCAAGLICIDYTASLQELCLPRCGS